MSTAMENQTILARISGFGDRVGNRFLDLINFCIRRRWWVLVFLTLVTVLAILQFEKLEMDTTNEAFYLETDTTKQLIEKFENLFGNEDFTYILIETDDYFKEEHLKITERLAEELKAKVPHVRDIVYLGNSEYIEGIPGGLRIRKFIEKIPQTEQEIKELKFKALAEEFLIDNFISRDATTAGILIYYDLYPDEGVDPRKETPPIIYEVLAQPEFADLKLWVTGTNIADYELDKLLGDQLGLLLSLSLLVEFVLLLILSEVPCYPWPW